MSASVRVPPISRPTVRGSTEPICPFCGEHEYGLCHYLMPTAVDPDSDHLPAAASVGCTHPKSPPAAPRSVEERGRALTRRAVG